MPSNCFAFDVTEQGVSWGLVSPDLTVLQHGSVNTIPGSADEACSLLAGLLQPYADQVACIGVSVQGGVPRDDPHGVIVLDETLRHLDGMPLGAELSYMTSLPVTVQNHGKASALGEYAAGALRGSSLGVVLHVGSRVQGGIVANGQVVYGAHGFAGAFGYLRTTPFLGELRPEDDVTGSCGWPALKRCILEAKGMLDMGDIDGHDLFDWVNRGDPDALRGLHEYAKTLCMWILNLQCVVDPQVVALGGGITAQPALFEALQTTLRAMVADLPSKQMPRPNVVACQCGDQASLLGVAYQAMGRK